mmetsp:Transcript_21593/g.48809  ORF Transcript_21593/g.48809 Transcript_21593/m.48809 type:complete len:237 (+) Transcript_21593:479-1189(+)
MDSFRPRPLPKYCVVNDYVNSVEPPIRVIRCPPGTQSMYLAERGQKRLLVLANPSLHYGRLSLVAWEDMFSAAQSQLDFHPMPEAEVSELRTKCHLINYSGRRPDGPTRRPRSLGEIGTSPSSGPTTRLPAARTSPGPKTPPAPAKSTAAELCGRFSRESSSSRQICTSSATPTPGTPCSPSAITFSAAMAPSTRSMTPPRICALALRLVPRPPPLPPRWSSTTRSPESSSPSCPL